jgi:hypothetical protein
MIDVLAIVGSDQWPDGAEVRVKALIRDYLAERPPDLLITSGVADVDSWAVEVAKELGVPYDDLNYLPACGRRWQPQGIKAGYLKMAQACTRVLAVGGTDSKRHSSSWMADHAARLQKPVELLSL